MGALKAALGWVTRIGADPADDDDIRLHKALLVACSLPFVFTAAAWGSMYYAFDEPLAGSIPLTYALFSLLSVIHFGVTRQYHFFRFLIVISSNLLSEQVNVKAVDIETLI